MAPGETLNRLGSYKEPHTGIIGKESEISPCGGLGALVRVGVKAGGGALLNAAWVDLCRFPVMLHHCGPTGLQYVL